MRMKFSGNNLYSTQTLNQKYIWVIIVLLTKLPYSSPPLNILIILSFFNLKEKPRKATKKLSISFTIQLKMKK